MRAPLNFIACGIVLAALHQPAGAQQVPTDPTSSHIFPAGGQRGTTVAVKVGGECLPPFTRFHLFGEGVAAPELLSKRAPMADEPAPRRKPGETHIYYPKEWASTIDIAPDAPTGQVLWRVSCARGGTAARPFIIGDLPEHIERESNSRSELAETITLPLVINGQIAGERDLDYYRLQVSQPTHLTIDLAAARLGSPLEAVLQVLDAGGRPLRTTELRAGSDPVVLVQLPSAGDYDLVVGNLGVQGGPHYVYRMTVTTLPYVRSVFPPGGTPGSTREVEFLTQAGGTTTTLGMAVAMPTGEPREFWFADPGRFANSVLFASGTGPEVVESEPNASPAQAAVVSAGQIVYGRFDSASDEDWYRFEAARDSAWTIECTAFPPGSPCLPIVSLVDAAGGVLATVSQADNPRRAARIEWRAAADGPCWLKVRDVQQGIQGSAEFVYRLALRPSTPDFSLEAAADFVNVVQGARAELEVKALRGGGFAGPIDLHVAGLPEGVTIESAQIAAGQESVKLVFVASADARSADSLLRITGTAAQPGPAGQRVALAAHLGHDSEGVGLGPTRVDHLQLTVRHKPVFRLYCNEAYQYAYRGTVYPYLMEIERLDGFAGEVHLQIADRQIKDLDGVEVLECTIPSGESQIMLPIYLPETMHINVQAHSNVYAQGWVVFDDRWGQRQAMLAVSEMRCMIRPLPTVARLAAAEHELVYAPGTAVSCHLQLARTSHFSGPMRVELVQAPAGVTADAVEIAAGQETAEVLVRMAAGVELPRDARLVFRGTGELPGYAAVISEASVELRSGHSP